MSEKVYLQYPWKFPDSPYYKSLIDNPPMGVIYQNVEKQKGVITNKRFFWISNFLKRNIRRVLHNTNLSIPNAHLSPEGDYDLIHCAHCLSKNEDKPWVADIESSWQFFLGKETTKSYKEVSKILTRKNCKRVMAWTEQTKKEILKKFPEIENKVEVIYPAIPNKIFTRKRRKEITLIFSGRYFYWKGGLHALEAIDQLTKKYKNVYGIINSEVPEDIKKRYSANGKISFYGLLSQDKLFELYQRSDIMIYPGYSDSFGFGFLEAMSFGIPIITFDGFARNEIVENGKTGKVLSLKSIPTPEFIKSLDSEIIEKIVEGADKLIKDKKLRDKMSNNCIQNIKKGKFSIGKRNEKIRKIYEDSLRKNGSD